MMETVRAERRKQRKRIVAALVASLLIHLLLVMAAFVILLLRLQWAPKTPPKKDIAPAEFTLVPPPVLPKKREPEFFDSSQAQVSPKAPKNPQFESDRNTAAASQLPAQSEEPLPSQKGEKEPGLTLQAQNLSLGPSREPAQPSPRSPARQQQVAQEKPRVEKPMKAQEKEQAKATPTPRPKPKPKPEEPEFALLEPAKPVPPKPQPTQPQPRDSSQPSAPKPPAYQPQTRITHLTGGISNRGRSSVDAVATPLGRYKKMLSDAIGSRWYFYVNDMLDMVEIGTVQVQFVVRADGKVERVQVLRNTSNHGLASCSVRSVVEAEIPPIPKELVPTLAGGKLEVDYSFTIVGR